MIKMNIPLLMIIIGYKYTKKYKITSTKKYINMIKK